MTTVPIANREDRPIESVADWELLASPGPGRWADEYSAKALAEYWIDGRGPDALLALFRDHGGGRFQGIQLERAVPEAQTRFDEWHGPRNHDLLVTARDDHGTFPICIEAKVNERFGETLDEYQANAQRKREKGEATHAPDRLAALTTSIAGSTLDSRPELRKLRYQLFSAIAGTIAEGNSGRGVFVVNDLRTSRADPEAQRDNAADLANFLELVFEVEPPSGDDWLVGPLRVASSTPQISADVDLWVGHLVTT